MDIIISVIVAEGVPSWVLHNALNATGLSGGARYTKAFAALGYGGMLGGMITLALIQAVSFFLTEVAIERIYICVIQQLCKDGISIKEIFKTIDTYNLSTGLKEKLKREVVTYTSR